MIICEMSLVFSQTDNPWFSFIWEGFIMYHYWTVVCLYMLRTSSEIWKFVNLISYVGQQRGSSWLEAFGISIAVVVY